MAQSWSIDEVRTWLEVEGFSEHCETFCGCHKIDGKALMLLTEEDLRNPPLQLMVLGEIKRLFLVISKLQHDNQSHCLGVGKLPLACGSATCGHGVEKRRIHLESEMSVPSDMDEAGERGLLSCNISKHLEPEYTKLLLSYMYMCSVFLLTAFVMVIVHDRVPDMQRYPPLPDLALDNLPLIPWAFNMCELTGMGLCAIFFIMLIFHKHRFIVMRRCFALTGTVFLLRCFTMLITSLSVPGPHLQCQPKDSEDGLTSKVERSLQIWKGFGMSLQGVRTCGDYMFSGHTVMVTMLNFFITEYTPRRMHMLHTACWVMNIFGIFFILAAHEHYSIDVFIAFYISSRLFLYYHTLANNKTLRQPDRRRTRIWFPMFSYFESKIAGIVPNEYEWPIPWPKHFKQHFENGKKYE